VSNRLGVYTGDVYLLVEDDSGARISSDRSFLLFAYQVGQHLDEFVVCGRGAESDEDADYVLPPGIRLVSLPHPPGDAVALADAIENLIDDPELRRQLVAHGLDLVRELTLEAEGDRVAMFLGGAE
jgi:glycosyltransferase involved in cell wall biosynthesis